MKKRRDRLVTLEVSQVEMWPYWARAASRSVAHVLTARRMVSSLMGRGRTAPSSSPPPPPLLLWDAPTPAPMAMAATTTRARTASVRFERRRRQNMSPSSTLVALWMGTCALSSGRALATGRPLVSSVSSPAVKAADDPTPPSSTSPPAPPLLTCLCRRSSVGGTSVGDGVMAYAPGRLDDWLVLRVAGAAEVEAAAAAAVDPEAEAAGAAEADVE
mmetsp:Transcript_17024/g.48903  ORF Transcript_17024/g.48903 Transcript_17024/m.48903 type:complete len:216 (+) Transcript_17024:1103-1750(+)